MPDALDEELHYKVGETGSDQKTVYGCLYYRQLVISLRCDDVDGTRNEEYDDQTAERSHVSDDGADFGVQRRQREADSDEADVEDHHVLPAAGENREL